MLGECERERRDQLGEMGASAGAGGVCVCICACACAVGTETEENLGGLLARSWTRVHTPIVVTPRPSENRG